MIEIAMVATCDRCGRRDKNTISAETVIRDKGRDLPPCWRRLRLDNPHQNVLNVKTADLCPNCANDVLRWLGRSQ